MKQREGPLELEKNLGKAVVVQNTSGRGPGVPGSIVNLATVRTRTATHTWTTSMEELSLITCDQSRPSLRRTDLRALGQTTKISRSTVEQVRARIQMLREKTKGASNAKSYDFEQRLADIKAKEASLRAEKLKLE